MEPKTYYQNNTDTMTNFPFASFTLFTFIMLFTPGPNNTMLATSGANAGIRKTLPNSLGVAIGFPIMLLFIGFGLGSLIEKWPPFKWILRTGSFLFIAWFVWKIITAKHLDEREENIHGKTETKTFKPLRYWQAMLFQWINAKAWVLATIIVGQYIRPDNYITDLMIVTGITTTLGLASSTSWTLFGTFFGKFLSNSKRLRIFNVILATLLVASVLWAYLSTS